ncbi:MAG: T9SS type A sorting domain-containing protein [Bacteroidetes bacterium]|nr:T9SS type A sorting domain-containing protein [Bacteroidota bacterium]
MSYQLSAYSYVTLKVYDILGNVVKTLVDGYKSQGKYSITFDASNLSSGIYFYRMTAGSYVEMKKLILLK